MHFSNACETGLDANIDFSWVINRSSRNTKLLIMVLWLCSNSSVMTRSTTFVYPVVQIMSLTELAIAPMWAGLPLQGRCRHRFFTSIYTRQSLDASRYRSSQLSGFTLDSNTGAQSRVRNLSRSEVQYSSTCREREGEREKKKTKLQDFL